MRRSRRGFRRGVGAAVTALAVLLLVPAAGAAQDLPSAGEMQQPPEQRDEDEESESSDEESAEESGGESSQAASSERESPEGETAEGASEQSSETAESEAPKEGEEAAAEGEQADAGKEGDTDKAGDGEEGDGKEKGEGEDEKRGEIVETTTDVEREVKGRGSTEGDRRWVQSGVNAWGLPGFQHITSAKPNRANTYDVSFFGEVTSGQNMIRNGDRNTFVGGRLNVHAQIIKYFSANVAVGATNNVNNFGRPEAMLSQGDAALGVRGHYPVQDFLDLGADVNLDFPTGFGSAGLDFAGTSVEPRLLGSFHLDPLVKNSTVPLSAHINAGYRVDRTANTVPGDLQLTRVERFAHDISDYDYVKLGVGVEYDVPYVSPFAAWNLDIPVNGPADACNRIGPDCVENFGPQAFPHTVSLGLRGEPVDQLSLHAGADVSLTSRQAAGIPSTPPYTLLFGANWQIDPRARVERVTKTVEKTRLVKEMPERGHLVGEVVDKKTGEPVGGAQIEYVDTDRAPQMTGSENGTFRSYGFEPGTELTVRVSHPKYHSSEVTGTLEKGEQDRTFELEPKPQKGTVRGTVKNQDGEPIAGATVRLSGPELTEVTTDSSGTFEAEVEGGKYGIGATSDDHLASNQTVDVPAGESTSVDFALEEGGDPSMVTVEDDQVKVEEKIHFETGTATLSQNSNVILDQVASTLKSHPELAKIEVAGHTDNVGTKENNMELSRDRAQTVYDYLVKQGVNPDRLVSKGYGPTEPLVPNISDENRSLNRRVEFHIVERRSESE